MMYVGFALTEHCNLRCPHCIRDDVTTVRNLPPELLFRTVDDALGIFGAGNVTASLTDPSVHVDALGSSSRTHRRWRFPRTRQTWLQQRMPQKKLLKRGPIQGISTTSPVEPLLPDLADAIREFQ